MYFSETPSLREIEKTMKMIPNFTPRGHGVVLLTKNGAVSLLLKNGNIIGKEKNKDVNASSDNA